MCMSDEVPEQLGYVEEISTGAFYPKGKLSPDRLNKKAIGQRYSFDLSYSASSKISQFKESYDKYYKLRDNYSIKPRFANELGSASYGFEIESDNGYIPERLCFLSIVMNFRCNCSILIFASCNAFCVSSTFACENSTISDR